MKKYYNKITKEWYYLGNIITRNIENGVFSGIPSEELLISWGFEEYIEPEPTEEQLIEKAKNNKLSLINEYNNSSKVNSFTINDNNMWLTVGERQLIAIQINSNELLGRDSMTKFYNGILFTFPLIQWKQMLAALEVYAGDALNVTEAHKIAVEALTTIEEINSYDHTKDYPEKLIFNIND